MFDFLSAIRKELGDKAYGELTVQQLSAMVRVYQAGYRAGHSAGVVAVNRGEITEVSQ